METLRVVFTKRKRNLISWLIRYAIPISRFQISKCSHCMIVDGKYAIEATMLHGVRRVLFEEALEGQTVTDIVDFEVEDAEAGLKWAREQVGGKYDFTGAFGLLLPPWREWDEESDWFCFELATATLKQAGREVFRKKGHITGTMLLAITPWFNKGRSNA